VRITKKNAVAVLACVALCAWAPKQSHVDVRSIGIIAAVGETCMFERVTDRPFEWIGPPDTSFLDISDWGIDDEVTKSVEAVLAPDYRVQSIVIEPQGFDTWTNGSLARRIRELPVPETQVDAYLLILRDWRGDDIDNSDHQLAGLGIYRRDRARGRTRYGVFASYRLILMEPNRGGILASRAALLPRDRLPWLPVSATLWPRTQNELSEAQRRALQIDFLKLIDATLPVTLLTLGLRSKIPAPSSEEH
jgi:hypothetical protein